MKQKRILIINGHPGQQSLSRALAEAYEDGASSSEHQVRTVQLHDLQFDLDHENGGYRNTKPLEPALEKFLQDMEWAEHIVMTTPMWWGGMPAKLKGLFDRAFLPRHAFNPRKIVWSTRTTAYEKKRSCHRHIGYTRVVHESRLPQRFVSSNKKAAIPIRRNNTDSIHTPESGKSSYAC